MNKQKQKRRRGVRVAAVLLCALTLLGVYALPASAAESYDTIPVYIDGERVTEGILINSTTYVPLRAFTEAAESYTYSEKLTVYWDARTSSAVVEGKDFYLIASQGKCYITVNGRYFYTVGDVLNLNGRIYVPIRPMAKAFGLILEWNGESRSVHLNATRERILTAKEFYNEADVYWLSRIINAESGGETFLGKVAVGNVVLNRKAHPSYPNTIYGVIFDRKHGTQFTPAATGTIYNTPNADSIIAAKLCLEGYSISSTALFFLNPRIATNFWIVQTRPFAFTIGNHDFYN